MKIHNLSLFLVAGLCLAGCHQAPKNMTAISGPRDSSAVHSETLFDLYNQRPTSGVFHSDRDTQIYGFRSALKEGKTRPLAFADYIGEELWIIHRPARDGAAAVQDDHYPGTGSLMTRVENREVPLPLKHTDVKASVTAYIASVDVTQQFENPYSEKIEAVYVFPLPDNGAVNEFVMQIGNRRIRGIV